MATVEQTALSPDDLASRLEESEARYASLIVRGGYGFYRSSANGRFIEINATLATMLGYDDAVDLLTIDLARDIYLDPEERERLITRAPVLPGEPDWIDTRWKRRDGSPLSVRISVRPRRDDQGALQWWEGMPRKPWPAEDRAALETINHEAIRSATIVKDLLAMARKRDHERRVPTDINDVVGYIARTRRYALDTAGVDCRLSLDPTLPPVLGDRTQLEQVILNLLNNAEHALTDTDEATGTRGHIAIRTRCDDTDVIIDVEDDGPGLPDAVRGHIWDPFWTTKDEGKGTGLGLAVVHGIICDHGGTITLESTPRAGACFVIRLPIARVVGRVADAGQATRPLDVLVVDPGAVDLLFVERFLTSRGHAVVNAGSGELALRLANERSFDAVVCDARLLGRDGKPVAMSLRLALARIDARFVLSVQSADDQHVSPAIPGAHVVARPYDVEELRRLIEGD